MIIDVVSGWKSELCALIDSDAKLKAAIPDPDEFEEMKLAMLAWPLHSSVQYPLFCASVMTRCAEFLDTINQRIPFVNVPNFDGDTILHRATKEGFIESVKVILTLPRLQPVISRQLQLWNVSNQTLYVQALKQVDSARLCSPLSEAS